MSEIGIGSRLKKEREAKGLHYEKISEDLKIQVKYLEFNLMAGEINQFDAGIFFIRPEI